LIIAIEDETKKEKEDILNQKKQKFFIPPLLVEYSHSTSKCFLLFLLTLFN